MITELSARFRITAFAAAVLVVHALLLVAPATVSALTTVKTIEVGSKPVDVAVNSSRNKIYVVNQDGNSVSVLDGTSNSETGVIYVGQAPDAVDVDPVTGKVYVANRGSNSVSVIDGSIDSVIRNVDVGSMPGATGVNVTSGKVYVANGGDATISVLDRSTDTVTKTIAMSASTDSIGVNPVTNKVYVTSGFSEAGGTVSVIDGSTDTMIGTIPVGQAPVPVAVNSSTNKIYVSNVADGSLSMIDGASDVVERTIETYHDQYGLCLNDVTGEVYVSNYFGSLASRDGTTCQFLKGVSVGSEPLGIDVNTLTNMIYVANSGDNTVSVVRDPPQGGSTFYFAEGSCRPDFETYFCILNPGESDAQVTIIYVKGDASTEIQDLVVPKHSRSTVKAKDMLGEGDDSSHDFSAIVQCTNGQMIVCERPMYFNYNGWTGGHDVVGATFPFDTWYFAEGTCRPGFDTYLCIGNPGDSAADVRITYMKGDGSIDTQDLTVGAHSRSTVVPRSVLGTGDDASHDFSIKVESTNGSEIVCERPMYFDYNGWTGGSDVVGAVMPSDGFGWAEGTCRPGFAPYVCVLNPGSSEAGVTVSCIDGNNEYHADDYMLAPHSRMTVDMRTTLGTGDDTAHDFFGSAFGHDSAKIIAERPMYFDYNGWTGGFDVMGSTEGSSVHYFAEGSCRPGFDAYLCLVNGGRTTADVDITYMRGDGSTLVQNIVFPGPSRITVHVPDILGVGDDAAYDFSIKVEGPVACERSMYFNYKGEWTGGSDVIGFAP